MDLNNPDKARAYLKQVTNGKIKDEDFGMQVENGRIKTNSNKRVTVRHVEMAEALTKFINTTPGVHLMSRKIMTLKIVNPGMTNEQVGLMMGLRNHEVIAYESDGKNKIKDYMRVCSITDGIEKFESNKGSFNEAQRFVKSHIHKTSPLIRT